MIKDSIEHLDSRQGDTFTIIKGGRGLWGADSIRWQIDIRPGSRQKFWWQKQINGAYRQWGKPDLIQSEGTPRWLMMCLAPLGLSIQTAKLEGRVQQSWDRLRTGVARPPRPPELSLQLLSATPATLAAVMALKVKVFSTTPYLCPPFASPLFRRWEVDRLRVQLEQHRSFGWYQSGQLRGCFGYQTIREGETSLAGIDFIFDHDIQGRGLARLAYRMMFARMLQDGLSVYQGSSANPRVLRLAQVMGRSLVRFDWGPYSQSLTRLSIHQERFDPWFNDHP